ncbi:MAG: FISUMP domain-containing protein [Myxococcaceae bacterium]|nr:FISUMP domain-containing protein [Myxococcaceae bacterium]
MRRSLAVLLFASFAQLACQAQPTKVEYASGNRQGALPATTLDTPLRLRVYGQQPVQASMTSGGPGEEPSDSFTPSEAPMAGVKVSFVVTAGGGSLSESIVETNENGYAATNWTIGRSGPQKVVATVFRDGMTPVNGSPFEFEATVIETGSFVDPRDQQTYATVTVGTQRWFAQNLRFDQPGSVVNPNFPSPDYGRLYTWPLARLACPPGWHLPSDDEWTLLELSLGKPPNEAGFLNSDNTYGRAMKSTNGWADGGAGTNTTGFNALPTGTWLGSAELAPVGTETRFWTSYEEPKDPKFAWDRSVRSDSTNFSNYGTLKVTAVSVRCLQN